MLNQINVGDSLVLSCYCLCCYGVVVVASGRSPPAYIRSLIRRIDRGVPNGHEQFANSGQCRYAFIQCEPKEVLQPIADGKTNQMETVLSQYRCLA